MGYTIRWVIYAIRSVTFDTIIEKIILDGLFELNFEFVVIVIVIIIVIAIAIIIIVWFKIIHVLIKVDTVIKLIVIKLIKIIILIIELIIILIFPSID